MNWTLIGLGCVGGALPDVIRVVKSRYEIELPKYWKSPNFWIGLIILVILGGLASWLGGAADPKSALAFGYGAPEVISRSLSSNNLVTMGASHLSDVMRRWWSF